MSLTRSLILLLLLTNLVSCRYGFVLEGTRGKKIALEASTNATHLRQAGIVLDTYLERTFASMGMLSSKGELQRLTCSIVSASRERITSTTLKSPDRYRLRVSVLAKLSDLNGKVVWQAAFSDQGSFSEGGQDEDALDEALRQISLQIGRAVSSL